MYMKALLALQPYLQLAKEGIHLKQSAINPNITDEEKGYIKAYADDMAFFIQGEDKTKRKHEKRRSIGV